MDETRRIRYEQIRKKLVRSFPYYVLMLLPIIYLVVFKYYPMYGVQIAFKDYKVRPGISGSPWATSLVDGVKVLDIFKHFKNFMSSPSSLVVISNTFILSIYYLLVSFPIPIFLAIFLNEARSKKFRKTVQLVTYMPYFISTVVLVSMLNQFTEYNSGFINNLAVTLGGHRINYMGEVGYFRSLYVWSGVWQATGYSAVIYLAALAGVNVELYDAARVDGANKVQRILNIDLPSIAPTIIILFILNTGNILNIGFEKIYLMQNSFNLSQSEVISTYVYKMGLQNFNYSYSTAVGLFNSLVNFVMIIGCNWISRKFTDTSLW